jgi:nitroreductase
MKAGDRPVPPLADIIVARHSTRAFSTDPVDDTLIESIVEAARWAPSYGNRQPTRYIVVREPETLAAVHEALRRGNGYAKRAPVLIAVCGVPGWGQIVDGREYYLLDAGLAIENLLLQAFHLGLVAHPMGGFDEGQVRAALRVPDGVRVLVLIAVGYRGSDDDLDERTREREARPRTRLPIDELRAWDRWPWTSHIEDDDGPSL